MGFFRLSEGDYCHDARGVLWGGGEHKALLCCLIFSRAELENVCPARHVNLNST